MIKYKGLTASILTDLSHELKRPVNLKESETLLKIFFHNCMKELDYDKSIKLLSNLPPFLKAFCFFSKEEYLPISELFSEENIYSTNRKVMKVLENYVQPQNLVNIYTCIPEKIFFETILVRKPALQKAS